MYGMQKLSTERIGVLQILSVLGTAPMFKPDHLICTTTIFEFKSGKGYCPG